MPARTVERDYVLAHIVAGFAGLERSTGLVFKGGTALRLCHFNDYRYSADLDFSIVAGTVEDAYSTIEERLPPQAVRLKDCTSPPISRQELVTSVLWDENEHSSSISPPTNWF